MKNTPKIIEPTMFEDYCSSFRGVLWLLFLFAVIVLGNGTGAFFVISAVFNREITKTESEIGYDVSKRLFI